MIDDLLCVMSSGLGFCFTAASTGAHGGGGEGGENRIATTARSDGGENAGQASKPSAKRKMHEKMQARKQRKVHEQMSTDSVGTVAWRTSVASKEPLQTCVKKMGVVDEAGPSKLWGGQLTPAMSSNALNRAKNSVSSEEATSGGRGTGRGRGWGRGRGRGSGQRGGQAKRFSSLLVRAMPAQVMPEQDDAHEESVQEDVYGSARRGKSPHHERDETDTAKKDEEKRGEETKGKEQKDETKPKTSTNSKVHDEIETDTKKKGKEGTEVSTKEIDEKQAGSLSGDGDEEKHLEDDADEQHAYAAPAATGQVKSPSGASPSALQNDSFTAMPRQPPQRQKVVAVMKEHSATYIKKKATLSVHNLSTGVNRGRSDGMDSVVGSGPTFAQAIGGKKKTTLSMSKISHPTGVDGVHHDNSDSVDSGGAGGGQTSSAFAKAVAGVLCMICN